MLSFGQYQNKEDENTLARLFTSLSTTCSQEIQNHNSIVYLLTKNSGFLYVAYVVKWYIM